MKKKTLNQQLGFTPVVKELPLRMEPYYHKTLDEYYDRFLSANGYYQDGDPRNPSKSKEKNPILKLLLAISIGALIGFSIIFISK